MKNNRIKERISFLVIKVSDFMIDHYQMNANRDIMSKDAEKTMLLALE
jgi:hypothetical protein